MENSKLKTTISIVLNIIFGITIAVLIFVMIGLNQGYKNDLETIKNQIETEKEAILLSSDFENKWEMDGFQANLVITPKCEIVSITFTLDFYNEKKQVVRTIKDTKYNLKRDTSYSFEYYFKDTTERQVYFKMIEGKVIANSRRGFNGEVFIG